MSDDEAKPPVPFDFANLTPPEAGVEVHCSACGATVEIARGHDSEACSRCGHIVILTGVEDVDA